MGTGKGYLPFTLYDYLNNVLHKPARVTGIYFVKNWVELCNAIAQRSGFGELHFAEDTIEKYNPEKEINVFNAHMPKSGLIVAEKRMKDTPDQAEILEKSRHRRSILG